MTTRNSWIAISILIAATIAVGLVAWPHLPAQVVSHWDGAGNPNGTMSRFWGVFLVPLMMVGLAALFWALPLLDPLRGNIARFKTYYNGFFVMLAVFFTYIYALTLAWNLGYHVSLVGWLVPAFAVLEYGLGMLLEHTHQNWFVGIRTPWTMSDARVWDATHRLGAVLFKVAALVTLVGAFVSVTQVWTIVVPMVVVALVTVVYSYVVYHRLHASS